MTEQEIKTRLAKIEDAVNTCMATNLAITAALSAMPGAAMIDPNKASTLLSGMVAQQASLAALEQKATALLAMILGNAAEAARR